MKRKIALIIATGLLISSAAWLMAIAAGHESMTPPDQFADLEKRITALEKVGPFQVVDDQGKPIFSVSSTSKANGAGLYNSAGVQVAQMGADVSGGYLQVTDGLRRGLVSFENDWSGISFVEQVTPTAAENGETHNEPRLELGRGEKGNYFLKILAPSGPAIAGIGESQAGTGAIIVGDPKDYKASFVVTDDGKGLIRVYNADSKAVASFGEAVGNTGGSLVLYDPKGEPRVKMGTNDNRYGVVMALPAGMPYIMRSGLPGSYMLGCTSGSSCVP